MVVKWCYCEVSGPITSKVNCYNAALKINKLKRHYRGIRVGKYIHFGTNFTFSLIIMGGGNRKSVTNFIFLVLTILVSASGRRLAGTNTDNMCGYSVSSSFYFNVS